MVTTHFDRSIFALFLLTGLARAGGAPSDVQHVNGTLVRVEPGLLHVKPSSPRAANAERLIAVDVDRVKVTKSEVDFSGVKNGPVALSQLRAGDPVSITIENGVAVPASRI